MTKNRTIKLVKFEESDAELTTENEGNELFLVLDSQRIAKRGQPGTVWAGKWISLRPDLEIIDGPDLEFITVRRKSAETP